MTWFEQKHYTILPICKIFQPRIDSEWVLIAKFCIMAPQNWMIGRLMTNSSLCLSHVENVLLLSLCVQKLTQVCVKCECSVENVCAQPNFVLSTELQPPESLILGQAMPFLLLMLQLTTEVHVHVHSLTARILLLSYW